MGRNRGRRSFFDMWRGAQRSDAMDEVVTATDLTAKQEEAETWTNHAPADVCGKCPIASTPIVRVSQRTWGTWIELARRFDTEWLAYCTGRLTREGAVLTGYYFPAQDATGAHVERVVDDADAIRPGTVGAVHSHVGMQAFWSEEDKRHCNWPVEIVLNRKGEAKCIIRHKLECGRYTRSDGQIHLSAGAQVDAVEVELSAALTKGKEIAKAKIPTPVIQPTSTCWKPGGAECICGHKWYVHSAKSNECMYAGCFCKQFQDKTGGVGPGKQERTGQVELNIAHSPSAETAKELIQIDDMLRAQEQERVESADIPVAGDVGWEG
jgi:hypothetical protein